MSAPLTAVELFAGAGGLALGTERAGFRHVAVVEWDSDARATLRQNRPAWSLTRERDVRDVDFARYRGVDLIAGGPPCQSFSQAGSRALGDSELNMFPAALQAIADSCPRAVLLENVTGLVWGKAAREYFERAVLGQLRRLGYCVEWRVINAADYGVPQLRKRVITVGFRRDVGARWAWPTPTYPWPTVRAGIAGLGTEPPPAWASGAGMNGCSSKGGILRVHVLDAPALTITTAVSATLLREDDGRMRFLAIREIARLQTFPDNWRFAGTDASQLRQLGNAVPVALAYALTSEVARALRDADRRWAVV